MKPQIPWACPYWDAIMDMWLGNYHYVLFRCHQPKPTIDLVDDPLYDINQAKECKLGFSWESSIYQPMIGVVLVMPDGTLELCREMYSRGGVEVTTKEAWDEATEWAYHYMERWDEGRSLLDSGSRS